MVLKKKHFDPCFFSTVFFFKKKKFFKKNTEHVFFQENTIHHASTCPLGTKKLPVLTFKYRNARNLYDGLKLRAKYTATLLKKTGQNNDTERS